MRRSAVLMTLLLSLFTFQSLWNVAAAYCVHENTSSSHHFGHHNLENTACATHADDAVSTTLDQSTTFNLQDHHDHLPSCFHIIVMEAQQQLAEPILQTLKLQQKYYWSNSYRSPHLSRVNPPPVLTPL
ncbi:MAG TPA: cation transporter [Acinetobacter sp.]|mgnify:CR=1 FL=1|nr:cation transporter [Acinetobacter sp.]